MLKLTPRLRAKNQYREDLDFPFRAIILGLPDLPALTCVVGSDRTTFHDIRFGRCAHNHACGAKREPGAIPGRPRRCKGGRRSIQPLRQYDVGRRFRERFPSQKTCHRPESARTLEGGWAGDVRLRAGACDRRR